MRKDFGIYKRTRDKKGYYYYSFYDEDGEPIKSSVLIPSTPPVIEKSKVQIEDETICLKAFEKHGYLDENEEICITKENFKEFYISYLTV